MVAMTKKNRPDLSIVIPAYKEERRVGNTLRRLRRFLDTNPVMKNLMVEILVVVADAPDNTEAVVTKELKAFPGSRLILAGPRVGKGRDVRTGVMAATGSAVLFMDADLATPLRYIPHFYAAFQNGFQVVFATRNLHEHHPQFVRRIISNLGNVLFRLLCGVSVEDSQCGFKLFSRASAQKCFANLSILGWGFDMEVLTVAHIYRLPMKAVRIEDWRSVPGGTYNDNVIKSSILSLVEMCNIVARKWLGRY